MFYKNNFAAGATILNLYMVRGYPRRGSSPTANMDQIFGGTNWGNLGHPGGYTSYDYGAVSVSEIPRAQLGLTVFSASGRTESLTAKNTPR